MHSDAEIIKSRASGRITSADLKDLVLKYLKSERHSTEIVDEIFDAVLQRVVMIVSRVEGTYEFEVQPLREYFAARYLYDTASYSPPGGERSGTKPDRFDAIARNFYWLNVTRFFCGCFSKDELLDLAERIKELTLDQIVGKTKYPVVLGAMLLSDWVFAQSPKAVKEISETLSTREALRCLAPSNMHYRPDWATQIPIQAGGERIIASAFGYLWERQTRTDSRVHLIALITESEDLGVLAHKWLNVAKSPMDCGVVTWLDIGHELGVLQRVDKSDVLEILSAIGAGIDVFPALVDAGRYDIAISRGVSEDFIVHSILDRPAKFINLRNFSAPVYLLATIVAMSRYLAISDKNIFHPSVRIALRTALKEQHYTYESDDALNATELTKPDAISRKFARLVMNDEAAFLDELRELLNESLNIWGERPNLIMLASVLEPAS